MEHAWLDSLSEDWVSQPASDASPSPSGRLPSQVHANTNSTTATSLRGSGSRVPRRSLGNNKPQPVSAENSSNILSERSLNDINIPGSRRGPSKLSQEVKFPERGRQLSRTVSASTTGSVVHNTVQHKSFSASPIKNKGQTPEWKRRLVYGNIAYGEHRDLFSCAGTELENIFKPPLPPNHPVQEPVGDHTERNEITLPSSPPTYGRDTSTVEIHVDESVVDELPATGGTRQPNHMQYRLQDDGTAETGMHTDPSLPHDYNPRRSDLSGHSALSFTHDQRTELELDSRKVSGQSVIQNEDLSPILISRHNSGDGKVTFAPIDLPAAELRKRLDKLRRNQMLLIADANGNIEGGSIRPDEASYGLENSDAFERLGGFINLRRGGWSADGSFQHRPLSSIPDTSEMFHDESLQASTPKQFPTIKINPTESDQSRSVSPPLPRVPHPSPEKINAGGQRNNDSPLKLFGPYDTFTNQTLLRRISQFEEQTTDGSRSSVRPSPEPGIARELPGSELSDAFVNGSGPREPEADRSHPSTRRTSISVSQFGAGQLDGFEFNEDFPYNSDDGAWPDADMDDFEPEDKIHQAPQPTRLNASRDSSPAETDELVIHRRRQKLVNSPSSRHTRTHSSAAMQKRAGDEKSPVLLTTPKKRDNAAEGKRPRTSPSKDPTPKRRRTLHKSDIAYGVEDPAAVIESVQLSHQQMQSIIGKKRKDARHGDLQRLANASVLATRQILRPRTPTPSQRSSVQREQNPLVDIEAAPRVGVKPGQANIQISAGTERKPSIKTEDFINEANKIMAMIRGKAAIGSGLASLEESEEEHFQQPEAEDSYEESTREPLDRPPSREGRQPIPRIPKMQEDPTVVQHLKKYEERSDTGNIISSSIRSIGLNLQAAQITGEAEHEARVVLRGESPRIPFEGDEIISDPPNIRISRNPTPHGHNDKDTQRDGFPSNGSSNSGHTGHSIPTGSSRGSDSRKTIAPQTVSHLIPDQVGSMVLDRERNVWVKRRSVGTYESGANILPSEGSEDPFAGIPDLSVDVTMELHNLKRVAAREQFVGASPGREVPGSPADFASMANPAKGSVLSAASLKSAEMEHDTSPTRSASRMIKTFTEERVEEEDVELEITINEDRVHTPKRRNLTISFSSPIASIIEDVIPGSPQNQGEESSLFQQPEDNTAQAAIRRIREQRSFRTRGKPLVPGSGSNLRGPTRPISLGGQAFLPRPVSRIEEHDEEPTVNDRVLSESRELSVLGDRSILETGLNSNDQRRATLSVTVTTPLRTVSCPVAGADPGPIIAQYVGRLSLSPLSEFTVHEDQSLPLEASYIVGDHHLVTADGSRRVVPLATRELVDKLAEVEPFEPYWEDMQELDFHDRRLSSLHLLDEFCGSLVHLDASGNAIRNLAGIPGSVRELKIAHNVLSDMSSWSQLINLQYVDISDNCLSSLSAFKNLVHLRSLRVDNNQLTSLDGIKYHDGLQSLRARGNLIEEVDFGGTRLHRLTELDLKGNKIRKVQNVDQLSSLSSLNLEGNQLESLVIGSEAPFLPLRYLRLCDNSLTSLNVSRIPSLRMLHADRNRLSHLTGFSKTRRLDSLSLREQHGAEPLRITFLAAAYEVRKLYLSGNLLRAFDPPADLLNCQLLELANCGLSSLPENLGQMLPNLRTVNLNFNALSDLSALRYIPRLKRLLAAGNRLASASATADLLAGFPRLAAADLRGNPLTQGFYPSLQILVRQEADATAVDPFRLPDADPERDEAYASRLDLDTRMRRRVYERVVAERCPRLRRLDGLPTSRSGTEVRKDAVWAALAAEGLVVNSDGSKVDVSELAVGGGGGGGQIGVEKEETARREVENSFA